MDETFTPVPLKNVSPPRQEVPDITSFSIRAIPSSGIVPVKSLKNQ
jgi:hypothetical protein